MSSRRTVQIPIVQPAGRSLAGDRAEDRLIEVYTQHYAFDPLTKQEEAQSREDDARARDKDWDRVAAPLRKVGLYQAGCAAASAVRKLGIRQPLTALYQRISRLAWIEGQRLQPAGAQGPSEGRSAELGLALVLLMCASGSRQRQIIATGALGGQARGTLEDDVEVLPVGSLPAKLRLVSTLAQHQGLPGIGAGGEVLFFTPRKFEQDGRWLEVESLPEVAQLKAQRVRVVPVERLSEAAAELRALRARHLFHDRVAQALVAALLLVAFTGYAWSALHQRPVVMTFLPGGGTALVPEPYRVCFTKDGGFYPSPLGREGLARSIPAGETLGWRVRIGEPEDGGTGIAGWFRPERYYVAQVMVSEHSQAKVMVPQLAGNETVTVSPGGIWEWGWQLNDRPENNGLVLLARPEAPFDPDALRAELIKQFPPAAGSDAGATLDVTAASNFIAGKAPGAAKFIIQTVERSVPCTP
ncbi:MAG TPA: hypothetical protein VHQ91_01605 [Geminicoccaceae bacterium]|jgi:hypothetical protein|nr:hypothetical protein [Geminicoccaceae bacterium]